MQPPSPVTRGLSILQRISLSLMAVLVMLTFVGANLHALLWQSSMWLVSTVLPAVVIELTNEERADNAALPLKRNATLDAAAKLKAEHMAEHEYFAHFSPEGVSPWHWFDESGYVYAFAGENLAIHFTDSSEVVEAWMNSPLHRQNIVDNRFTEIGVGTAKGKYEGYDTVYVVQLFGTPAVPKAPLVPAPKSPFPVAQPVEMATSPDTSEIQLVEEDVPKVPVVRQMEITAPAETVVLDTEVALATPTPIPPEPTQVEDDEITVVSHESDAEAEAVEPLDTLEITAAPVAERPEDVVSLEMPFLSTSTGLAIANVTTKPDAHAGATLAIITQPNRLLETVYTILVFLVLMLLGTSVLLGAKRLQPERVAYGVFLMIAMGGLWFINSLLTSGAVVV